MNDAAPIVRKGRKFGQVLEGARQVFMTDGFEGANVDDIAKQAGVSKATLY
ncbi:TetR/AcrR family transcriptional regulator, partial [Tateyamaria sp.]|nr:TetR/AcrR family transcriptional regulator [Tateyamaria sp.]